MKRILFSYKTFWNGTDVRIPCRVGVYCKSVNTIGSDPPGTLIS